MAPESENMLLGVMDITPKMAYRWLKKRNKSKPEFHDNDDMRAITFDQDGDLVGGIHHLEYIGLTKYPQRHLVIAETDSEEMQNFLRGKVDASK